MCLASQEVPPQIQNGYQKRKAEIGLGLASLSCIYAFCFSYCREAKSIWGLPAPAEEFCTESGEQQVCSRSDLFAFQVASGVAIAICGAVGFDAWCVSRKVHTALPQTPQGRLFGYLPESETIAAVNFTFQVWDFFISLLIPEHRGALMLAHHSLAALICWCSLEFQMLHYYGIFFLGLTETSSIFLVLIDLAKFFPPESGTFFDSLIGVVGPCFVVSFTLVRVVLWWKVSFLLWRDCYHVVTTGIAEQLRPGKSGVLYVFLVLNIPLGLLQLYWFTIITEEAMKVLGPST